MQTIGLVGGMSWHSTLEYYRTINTMVNEREGGHSSAKVVLASLDFAEVRDLQLAGDWAGAGRLLADAARRCEAGGADLVLICTNLMHKVADEVEDALGVPLLRITDAVAEVALAQGWSRVGLLGTRWIMEEDFYPDALRAAGLEVLVPPEPERAMVDRVVFDELVHGQVEPVSRAAYVEVIEALAVRGAQAVVLACTEIELLLGPGDSPLPLVPTAAVHAEAAVSAALRPPSTPRP